MNTLGRNRTFPIYKSDGTSFHDLVLHKSTCESVVMSLGDKITGDVYYKDNTLAVTMQEYIKFKVNPDDANEDEVKYVLVSPPTVVREGMASDNSELKGMTKYSFTFYHPMCALSNFPFSDVAVSDDEKKYLSQNKTFTWMGNGNDLIAKLNKNLEGTQWVVVSSGDASTNAILSKFPSQVQAKKTEGEKSDVLSFDKNFISDVLKVFYDNWGIPFVIDSLKPNEYFDDNNVDYYSLEGGSKRFVIVFGNPTNTILDDNDNEFVFRFGQGVGLKNNSRTQKNNKIITRIAGYGSENNIPYGYPQIIWYGDQTWDYTINNDSTDQNSFQIYRGIVNGQYVKLIKHPFTRKNLMPTVYVESVFNKVSPYAVRTLPSGAITANPNYDPDIEIVDYYDAVDDANIQYPNPIVPSSPSFEIHQFENIKPQLGDKYVVAISAYDEKEKDSISIQAFTAFINGEIAAATADNDGITARYLTEMLAAFNESMQETPHQNVQRGYTGGSYTYEWILRFDGNYCEAFYNSPVTTFTKVIKVDNQAVVWDDSIGDDGNYKQSYFKMTIQQLEFDLYACASITESMQINMRSGACMGCTFDVQVDWDDYKKNFYDANGDFAPTGSQRDYTKYPDSSQGQITLVVAKDTDTFGTILPDSYRTVAANDAFVILGISLPQSYVTAAQVRLDEAMKEYMLENNVYYYDYPLKFDEHFLATHNNILAQIRNNVGIKFIYGDEPAKRLFVKQMTIKYGDAPLPTYDIVLTDDIEIVLNSVGQVTDDVSRMRVQMSELQKYYGINIENVINEKLSRVEDDIAKGRITFQQGLDAIGRVIFSDEIKSKGFVQGMTDQGRGWRIDAQGNAEFESLRCRSYLEVIELLINRLQAQEGDTLFTDNDQITFVEEKTYNETTYYKLTLKEKWNGYTTCQKVGNIIKGIINTLAANAGNVSDVTPQQSVESDGDNKYFTSWMRVINPADVGDAVGNNQICVVLYGDSDTPANKNFAPCELMNIARWGCSLNPNEQGITEAEKADRKRRQNLFYISTSDGRLVKLNGVNAPKLSDGNYGTTLGELPDFVKAYSAVAARLVDGGDYLYAQGIVVGDFIKIDKQGVPITNYVDKGEWQNNTEYLCNEYDENAMQYETHDVWHNNAYWRCLQHQPVTSGGTTRYYEPTDANSAYWKKLMYSQQGQHGYNSATLIIYKRSASEPASNDKPLDLTYYFSTGSASGNMNGWSWEIPTANGLPCWTRQVFISSRSDTEEIPSGNWGNPQALVEDGISYEIQVPVESIRFASGQTAYTLNGDANFFKKSGSASKVQTQFYYAVYKRTGNSYVKVASGQANKYTFSNLSVPSTIDAITVYIFDASYSGTTPETNGYLAKAEIKVNKDGESPYFADLDNEMDSIACATDGKPSSPQTVQTNVSLFYGTTPLSFTISVHDNTPSGAAYTNGTQKNGITITWDNSTGNVQVAFATSTAMDTVKTFCITLTTTHNGATVTRDLYFVVNCVRAAADGSPAVLYKLMPSTSSIKRDKSNNLTPSSPMTCDVQKVVGNNTPTRATTSDGTLRYMVDGDITSSSQGTAITINSGTVAYSSSNKYITFAFFVGSTLVDKEKVLIIYDGSDGEDVAIAYASPATKSVTCKPSGGVFAMVYWNVDFSLFVGTTQATVTSVSLVGSLPNGVSLSQIDTDTYEITVRTSATAIGLSSALVFNVSGTLNGVTYTSKVSVSIIPARMGNDGDDGVNYDIVLTIAQAKVDSDNIVAAELAGYAYKYEGSTQTALSGATIRYGYVLNDSDTYTTTTTNSSGFFDSQAWFYGDNIETFGKGSPTIFAALIIDGVIVHTEYVTLAFEGKEGKRGKMGRSFYYGEEWYDLETPLYIVTDAQAPYFKHNDSYWVFNPEQNYPNGISMHDMGEPSSSDANWQIMTNDFKFIITEAIFGDFAHFGANIINGDYRYSQHGYMRGFYNQLIEANYGANNYKNIDPLDPFGDDDLISKSDRKVSNTSWVNGTDVIAYSSQNWYYNIIGNNCQFAANSSPSASQIHQKYKSGDLYFRYRSEGASTWGGWVLISNYTFAISSNNGNTSSSPSSISSSWTSTPPATTQEKPYLWLKTASNACQRISSKTPIFSLLKNNYYAILIESLYEDNLNFNIHVGNETSYVQTAQMNLIKETYDYNGEQRLRVYGVFYFGGSNINNADIWISGDRLVYFTAIYKAQFIPNLCEDLSNGRLVVNNISARGQLHSESLYYEHIKGIGNNEIVVKDETIITIGQQDANASITLPAPTENIKGRVIEIYSGLKDDGIWRLGFDGATSQDNFGYPCGDGSSYKIANWREWNETYVKLRCNGTTWDVIKAEKVSYEDNKYYVQLASKVHVNQ